MFNIKRLKNEITLFQDMTLLLEAYQEIAATRMRRSKSRVLTNRDFFEGLNDLYHKIFIYYNLLVKKLNAKGRHSVAKSFLSTNGKTLSILLSTSTGLYGDIPNRTFKLFADNTTATSTDIAIIGKYGMKMYEEYPYKRPYKFFDIKVPGSNESDIHDVASYIVKYTNIIVYHGLFKTVLNQEPVKDFITGDLIDLQKTLGEEKEKNTIVLSIFEPSIERLAEFFETEILSSLFDQAVNESNLSSLASRMISLHSAVDSAQKVVLKLNNSLKREKHALLNSKQQNLMSAVWASNISNNHAR